MEVQLILHTSDEQQLAHLIAHLVKGYLPGRKWSVSMTGDTMTIMDVNSPELAQK